MTEADLQRIERELAIALPAVYRKAMLSFSLHPFVGNSETELWDNADKLIELNRELRRGTSAGMEPWPTQFFCIGRDLGGDCYALILSDPEAGVRWVDRGHLNVADAALTPPFADWIQTCLEDMRIYLEEHGVDPRTGTPDDLRRAEERYANAGCRFMVALIVLGVGLVLAALALLAWLQS